MAIDKLTAFAEIKALGQRWLSGERKPLIDDLLALRRPKAAVYPAAVHRYIVKEAGFPAGSEFIISLLNEVAS